jgi:hypothetical protein
MPPQAYHTSQYMVPRGGLFFGKWRSTLAGSSDGKMNVQSACALNILYMPICFAFFMYLHSRPLLGYPTAPFACISFNNHVINKGF